MSNPRLITSIKVTGTEKRYKPNHHIVYIIKVKWSDGTSYIVYRTYGMLYEFHGKLEEMIAELGKKKFKLQFPGTRLSAAIGTTRFVKRMNKELDSYCQKLLNLPVKKPALAVIHGFFEALHTDIHPPRDVCFRPEKTSTLMKALLPFSCRMGITKSQDAVFDISSPLATQQHLVLADLSPQEKTQVPLIKGHIVDVIEKNSTGWWLVSNRNSLTGWAPAGYLQPVEDVDEKTEITIEDLEGKKFFALYSYKAMHEDELSFDAGVQLDVLKQTLDGWWIARYCDEVGYIPASYVTEYNNAHWLKLRTPMPVVGKSGIFSSMLSPMGGSVRDNSLERGTDRNKLGNFLTVPGYEAAAISPRRCSITDLPDRFSGTSNRDKDLYNLRRLSTKRAKKMRGASIFSQDDMVLTPYKNHEPNQLQKKENFPNITRQNLVLTHMNSFYNPDDSDVFEKQQMTHISDSIKKFSKGSVEDDCSPSTLEGAFDTLKRIRKSKNDLADSDPKKQLSKAIQALEYLTNHLKGIQDDKLNQDEIQNEKIPSKPVKENEVPTLDAKVYVDQATSPFKDVPGNELSENQPECVGECESKKGSEIETKSKNVCEIETKFNRKCEKETKIKNVYERESKLNNNDIENECVSFNVFEYSASAERKVYPVEIESESKNDMTWETIDQHGTSVIDLDGLGGFDSLVDSFNHTKIIAVPIETDIDFVSEQLGDVKIQDSNPNNESSDTPPFDINSSFWKKDLGKITRPKKTRIPKHPYPGSWIERYIGRRKLASHKFSITLTDPTGNTTEIDSSDSPVHSRVE